MNLRTGLAIAGEAICLIVHGRVGPLADCLFEVEQRIFVPQIGFEARDFLAKRTSINQRQCHTPRLRRALHAAAQVSHFAVKSTS